MVCCICEKETLPRRIYCDRCRTLVGSNERTKRRAALRMAYDRSADGFRCHWCGVLLEEEDYADPFHLCFDHLIPEKTSELVVSSQLFNRMKDQLAPEELPLAFRELAAHRAGRPFDRDLIEFRYWSRRVAPPERPGGPPHRGALKLVKVEKCVVCGREPVQWSYYCPRCRRLVLHTLDQRHYVRAMKEAWSEEEDGFLCHYTGARVDDDEPEGPWYLSFDHGIPGDEGTLVVAAWWVNAMKSALSKEEFWKVVGEYDRYLREGGEFDRDVVGFRYWRRSGKRG
jgi:hypothetical protein